MLTLNLIINVRMYRTMFIIFRLSLKYVDSNFDYCTFILLFIQICHVQQVVIAADLLHVYVGVKRRVVVNEEQEIYEGPKNVALEDVVFGGGPEDKSGLTEYVDHVGCEQWDDLVY